MNSHHPSVGSIAYKIYSIGSDADFIDEFGVCCGSHWWQAIILVQADGTPEMDCLYCSVCYRFLCLREDVPLWK